MITKFKYENWATEVEYSATLTEDKFQNILEQSFAALSIGNKYSSDLVLDGPEKQFHTFLLTVSADFVRNDTSKEDIEQFLLRSCGISSPRVQKYLELYEKNKQYVRFSLLNIGTFLPHITDVKWKMDYIVKSSMVEESEGPLFRISLVTEKYDETDKCNKTKNINFTCTSQELKDLVYKLKDAVRHCNTLTNKFN